MTIDTNLILVILVTAVVVIIISMLLPGVKMKGFIPAILVSIGMAVFKAFFQGPILSFLNTSNGLVNKAVEFVVFSLLVMLLSFIIPGFKVNSFWTALLFSLVFVLAGFLIDNYLIELI